MEEEERVRVEKGRMDDNGEREGDSGGQRVGVGMEWLELRRGSSNMISNLIQYLKDVQNFASINNP